MVNDEKVSSNEWHTNSAEAVLQKLDVSEKGLSADAAEDRLKEQGPNLLPEAPKQSAFLRFLLQFHNVLIYILIAAAGVTALMQHWIDTGVILGVVIINSIIGFIQEGKAERALEGIRKMLSLTAIITRDGKKIEVKAESLVTGDIVHLESGDRVPADLRLLYVRNLAVEESPLTGESLPVTKQTAALEGSIPVGDRKNLAFSGTTVTSGRGTGVVFATGARTEIGKISELMSSVEAIKTPLLQQMDQFGKILSLVIGFLAVAFFAIGYFLRDYPFNEIMLAVIGLAVAAIPEGLPAIMTITLAIGVQRMAHQKAIIRRLPSVETLGSVTVICSDKTGTLTRNEMTVQRLITPTGGYKATGSGYAPAGTIENNEGETIDAAEVPALRELIRCIALCNDSELRENKGQWTVQGDPTEGGLRTLEMKAGSFVAEERRVDTLPFESEHKYMATLNESEEGSRTIWIKGAPERILERCHKVWGDDGPQALDEAHWRETIETIASRGERVLAAACLPVAAEVNSVEHDTMKGDLILLGLVGMMDPPREEAIQAVNDCRTAGIRVKMITGDHAKTASAIARQLGLEAWEHPLSGAELDNMDEAELSQAAKKCDVFARTSPENKLRLVEALQRSGEITAMTGDGVNDAPALKRSDVGIAMGVKGTEVTKDASEMVLADDNFATIARAVREGRTLYDNLRKAILFILPTNGAQALVIMLAILFGMQLPITPVQILWVNMVTAVTLAFAFTFEPSEAGVMERPPRRSTDGILDRMFIWRISFVSILLAGFTIVFYKSILSDGGSEQLATTVAVNTLAAGQLFYMFNCRSLRNSILSQGIFTNGVAWLMVGILAVLQILFTYAGFMQTLFGTEGVPLAVWPRIFAVGALVLILVETEKWVIRRFSAADEK